MYQGRGSAGRAMVIIVALVWLSCSHFGSVEGASYTVGGSAGWTFNSSNWPKGKPFKAGDVLIFNYDPKVHNVVAVNVGGYNACTAPASATVYGTGKDQVKLAKGTNYFICSIAGHCGSGMKIAVNAA